jgi:hypothetical protein
LATGPISPDGRLIVARWPLVKGRRPHAVIDYELKLVNLHTSTHETPLDALFVPTWTPDGELVGGTPGERGRQLAAFDLTPRPDRCPRERRVHPFLRDRHRQRRARRVRGRVRHGSPGPDKDFVRAMVPYMLDRRH